MPTFEVGGRSYQVDEDGFLENPEVWSQEVAKDFAGSEGVETLTEDHWKIINALREYYAKFGVAPEINHVCLAEGHDWHWAHDLFHTCLNAWRVSGLPDPGEEAKSYLSAM